MEAVKAKLAYTRPGEAILRNFPPSSPGQPQDKSLLEPVVTNWSRSETVTVLLQGL